MATQKELLERLDRLTHEIAQIKASLINQAVSSSAQTDDDAWQDLMDASEEISSLWTGPSALDEIKAQRR
jgi:hypothetical protein